MLPVEELRQRLEEGPLEAHRESEGERGPECTTVVVRKLPIGSYHLVIDRYLLIPPYGEDLDMYAEHFEDPALLLVTMREHGFELSDLQSADAD